VTVYSHALSTLFTIPLSVPVFTGSGRWLIYPVSRPSPTITRSPILDTPPETRLYERVARGLTKEVVSWGRETGEKIGEAISSYLNGPQTIPEKRSPPPTHTGGRHLTTVAIHDIPNNTILTQFQVPYKLGYISLSPSGTMLFCSPPKGDEFFVYSLSQIPTEIHLVATFSRGYTYSRVMDVVWRGDSGCMGVISARGTGHLFSLKRRGKETARAVGKVKIDGGVKGFMFLRRHDRGRRRSSTTKEEVPDILTVANLHERVTSWKITAAAQRSAIGLLTSYFNPPTNDEPQSIPLARPIADYIFPSTHQELPFPSFITSPIIKAAFTNQKEPATLDCTAKAELECSVSTRGVTGIRGIRLFEYTLAVPYNDFGSPLPWTSREIDLGMPRGEVRYFATETSSSGSRSIETPPSSEQDSPDLQPDNKKKRRNRGNKTVVNSDTGIERAISVSLGTELDKTRMVTVPPTPPGSFSTPKITSSEWMGDILDRGKTIVRNVRRGSSNARVSNDDEVCFEEGVEVLSLNDVPGMDSLSLDRSESAESDGSGHGKVRVDGSMVEELDPWDT
jgi:hypothetical protein